MVQRNPRGIGYFKALVNTMVNKKGFDLSDQLGQDLMESFQGIEPSLYPGCNEERLDAGALVYCFNRFPAGYEAFRRIEIVTEDDIRQEGGRTWLVSKGGRALELKPLASPHRRAASYVSPDGDLVMFPRGGMMDLYDMACKMLCVASEAYKIGNAMPGIFRRKRFEKALNGSREEQISVLADITGLPYDELSDSEKILKEPLRGQFPKILYNLGERARERRGFFGGKGYSIEAEVSENYQQKAGFKAERRWAEKIAKVLKREDVKGRPLIILSANLFSPLALLSPYARDAIETGHENRDEYLYEFYSKLRNHLASAPNSQMYSSANSGIMAPIPDTANTGIDCQLFDLAKVDWDRTDIHLNPNREFVRSERPLLLVMDYPFGSDQSQALVQYLTMALKGQNPIIGFGTVGKAATFSGEPGDIMIPRYFIREGHPYASCDMHNAIDPDDGTIRYFGLHIESGGQKKGETGFVTLDGTFLGNDPLYEYFLKQMQIPGGEMEGFGLAMGLQSSILRGRLDPDLRRTAIYYASDNPLKMHEKKSLAAGSLSPEKGTNAVFACTIASLNYLLNP